MSLLNHPVVKYLLAFFLSLFFVFLNLVLLFHKVGFRGKFYTYCRSHQKTGGSQLDVILQLAEDFPFPLILIAADLPRFFTDSQLLEITQPSSEKKFLIFQRTRVVCYTQDHYSRTPGIKTAEHILSYHSPNLLFLAFIFSSLPTSYCTLYQ